jgi:RNA polymerase sigma-70 factor, ECF subfamily
MRRWLVRTLEETTMRAEEPRSRFARWTVRWFPPAPPVVPPTRFQGPDDPFPRHWREPPTPWTGADPAEPSVQHVIALALSELPETWRTVVLARDVDHEPAARIVEELGLTRAQQEAILGRSRELLRRRIADLHPGSGEP